MKQTQLIDLSVSDMRRGLLSRDFSAAELTEAHLDRIQQTNGTYNSFITVTEEIARVEAKRADTILKDRKDQSPALCGIPIALKDALVTRESKTTCGSKMLENFVSPYDCTVSEKLKAAGAVLLGKTNMDEFAMGSSSEHSAFGPVRNPWNPSRVPGGTSGGSAAAVALGQAPITLGTDTGGSVRQPAAFCGVLGLKPTYGRVSRYGLVAHASSFDQIGPLARSAEDLAILLTAISGKDDRDSTSMDRAVPDFAAELLLAGNSTLSGLRIGVPKEYLGDGLQPEVLASFRRTLENLERLGAKVVDISLPHTQYALACYYIITPAEASSNLARYDGARYGLRAPAAANIEEMYERTRSKGFGREVKRRILVGTYVLSTGYYDAYYRKAQQVRTLVINDFKAAFANYCDVIATPTTPSTAFGLGAKTASPLEMYLADIYTVPVNLAGLPGLSIPCGLDAEGLPVGLQLIGAPFQESKLLQTAHVYLHNHPFDSSKLRSAKA